MNKTLFLAILNLLIVLSLKAQTNIAPPRFGVFYIQNFSAQINYNPQRPQDEKSQWNRLPTIGIGTFYERFVGRKLSVALHGSYQVKGYKEIAQIAEVFIPNSFRENEYANRFRYLTLELNPTYHLSNPGVVRPFVSAGLNGNYLLSKDLGSDVYPIKNSYPVNEYNGFRRWSIGYNLSAGMAINELLILEGKFQKDITPILDKENLQVWNWVWSINFKINVGQIIKDLEQKRS